MDAIFQQAPFDDRNDIKRIEAAAKEMEQQLLKTPGLGRGKCDLCGCYGQCFARIIDAKFICIKCLIQQRLKDMK